MAYTPETVYRDFENPSIPSPATVWEPLKREIRALLRSIIDGAGSGSFSSNVIILSVTGGTANAIIASTAVFPAAPDGAIYILQAPLAPNTGPTTLTVDARPAEAIKTREGSPFIGDELVLGVPAVLYHFDGEFRLLLDAGDVEANAILSEVIAARDISVANANTVVQADFETRADAALVSIAGTRNKIVIGRHSTGKRWAPAHYIRGTSTGPLAFQDAASAWWELAPSQRFKFEFWGAVGNALMSGGHATGTDDGAACRQAVDDVSIKLGGGSIYLLSNYLLSTMRGLAAVNNRSNVRIIGPENTGFLWADGVNSVSQAFATFFHIDVSGTYVADNWQLVGFTVDCNGANNLTVAGWNGGLGFYQNQVVGHYYGQKPLVRDLHIKNHPGSSPIQIATGDGVTKMRGVVVAGCELIDCGEVVNSLVADCSMIYVDADDYEIFANRLRQTTQGWRSCAIEMHGTNGHAHHNKIENVLKACNIAADSRSSRGLRFTDNDGDGLIKGAQFFCSSGLGLEATKFNRNTLRQANLATVLAAHPGLDVRDFIDGSSQIVSGSVVGRIETKDNLISTLTTDSSILVIGIVIGRCQTWDFSGTLAELLTGPLVSLGTFVNGRTVIIGNGAVADGCGHQDNTAYRVGMLFNSSDTLGALVLNGVTIRVNTSAPLMSYGISGNAPVTANGKVIANYAIIGANIAAVNYP